MFFPFGSRSCSRVGPPAPTKFTAWRMRSSHSCRSSPIFMDAMGLPQSWVDGGPGIGFPWLSHMNSSLLFFLEITYPLVNIQKTMEHHHAIHGSIHYFYGHVQSLFVCLPEGSHSHSTTCRKKCSVSKWGGLPPGFPGVVGWPGAD